MPSPSTPSASRFEREAKTLAALNHPTIKFWVQRWVKWRTISRFSDS
jgi:hypothetical protein